jgi:hypothetical protein
MAYPKQGNMNNPVGLYSSKDNPLPAAKRVMPECGPGSNPDQAKANKLLQQNHAKNESLRGKSGK